MRGLPEYLASALDAFAAVCYQRGQWTAVPRGHTPEERKEAARLAKATRAARYDLQQAIQRYRTDPGVS